MKKLLAIILAVAMVMSMAVAVSADAPEGEANLINYDFENGDISAWAHHWGNGALSVTDDGMLHTEKKTENIWFTTYTNLPVLTAGTEYKVTADIYLCDNEYLVSKETGETAPFESATFTVAIKTGGIDGTALASKKQTIVCGDTETFTFTYTPNADVTDATLCFNMDGSNQSLDGVSYCLDNVKITYALPEEEAPETTIIKVTETGREAVITGGPFSSVQWGTSSVESSFTSDDVRLSYDWYFPNIAGLVTSVAPLADVTHVKVNITADNAETWPYPNETWNKTPTAIIRTQDNGGYGVIANDVQFNPSTGVAVIEFDVVDGTVVAKNNGWNSDAANVGTYVDASKLIFIPSGFNPNLASVTFTVSVEVTYNKEVSLVEETYRGSGYFMTGEETHAMIIGKAIITTPHEFNENGDCKYCRYHTEVVVEDIIVEQPTESTEEESEDITVEEPKEDTNPGTGLTLAVIPAIVALAAVVISKR